MIGIVDFQSHFSRKQRKKDVAYLKDIDAYDFREASMISILLDFIPDEAYKEITTRHVTVGDKSSSLKQILAELEKIIQREKIRKESRRDRHSSRKAGKPRLRPRRHSQATTSMYAIKMKHSIVGTLMHSRGMVDSLRLR